MCFVLKRDIKVSLYNFLSQGLSTKTIKDSYLDPEKD